MMGYRFNLKRKNMKTDHEGNPLTYWGGKKNETINRIKQSIEKQINMKTSELRIGNYVKYCNRIEQLDAELFLKLLKYTTPFDPIQLTEKWLLKFGFIYTEIHVGFNQFRKGILELSITPNGYEIFFTYKWVKIEYVHQLQNLYFALTNEELTYKNNR